MKKIISLIFILTFLVSCSNTVGYKPHEERKYKEVICPKCEGTGKVPRQPVKKSVMIFVLLECRFLVKKSN